MENFSGIDPTKMYVVTSDDWFYDANGNNVKGAVGHIVPVKAEEALGFSPKRSADWFLQITTQSGQVVYIAGCKIHHVCEAQDRQYPNNSLST